MTANPQAAKATVAPPPQVQQACRQGLQQLGEAKVPRSVKQRAEGLAKGTPISPHMLARLRTFHDKHAQGLFDDDKPTAQVAFLLAGGDAGRQWVAQTALEKKKPAEVETPAPTLPQDAPSAPSAPAKSMPAKKEEVPRQTVKPAPAKIKAKPIQAHKPEQKSAPPLVKKKRRPVPQAEPTIKSATQAYVSAVYGRISTQSHQIASDTQNLLKKFLGK